VGVRRVGDLDESASDRFRAQPDDEIGEVRVGGEVVTEVLRTGRRQVRVGAGADSHHRCDVGVGLDACEDEVGDDPWVHRVSFGRWSAERQPERPTQVTIGFSTMHTTSGRRRAARARGRRNRTLPA